ncbi:YcxB family protein [uncultured Microbacterium sp.]|uniref:YcxB-like protein domain-containing protein n=1 Tax=uncultured Microbacterium sp. TaxID=191216 RepID=A0A1Y5P4Q5_9MICO|nr:YcxB family protein [uncultured Microbacterium sp.]SBS72510.1 hypothetical protein MIPYR_30055 [uncultured Microbacterium sp.]
MPTSANSIVADAGMPTRLAAAYLRWELSRRRWIAVWVIGAIGAAFAIFVAVTLGDAAVLWLLALWVALIGAIVGLTYRMTRTSVRRAHPAGSSISVQVGDEGLAYESAMGRGDVRFAALRAVHATPDAVLVRLHTSPAVALFPRAVFTDDDLARLQRAITPGR